MALSAPSASAADSSAVAANTVTRTASAVVVDGQSYAPQGASDIVQTVIRDKTSNYGVLTASTLDTAADVTPELSIVSTYKTVSLSWKTVPGATKYEVYREADLLSTITPQGTLNTYHDNAPVRGKAVRYSVIATTSTAPPEGGSKTLVAGVTESGQATPGVYSQESEDVINNPTPPPAYQVEISSVTDVPTDTTQSAATAALNSANARTLAAQVSVIRHTTFIPTATTGAIGPFACQQGIQRNFLGDNRSWSVSSEAYRTRINVYFNWFNNSIGAGLNVHATHLINLDGSISEQTASNSGMRVYRVNNLSSDPSGTMRVHVDHSVGDPYCSVGAINYSWSARVTRSGSYSIWGSTRPVPNHEIYYDQQWAKGDFGRWYTLYRATSQGYQCLVADWVCGRVSINASGVGITPVA